jgi:hypothetical protein
MHYDTATALDESIAHWERNMFGPFEEVGIHADECALCDLFYGGGYKDEDEDDTLCLECPVRAATGQSQCKGSPWEDVQEAYQEAQRAQWGFGGSMYLAELAFREAARKMLVFLMSLRVED